MIIKYKHIYKEKWMYRLAVEEINEQQLEENDDQELEEIEAELDDDFEDEEETEEELSGKSDDDGDEEWIDVRKRKAAIRDEKKKAVQVECEVILDDEQVEKGSIQVEPINKLGFIFCLSRVHVLECKC